MKRSTKLVAAIAALAAAGALAAVNGCTIVNGLVADPPDGGGVTTEGGGGDAEAGPPGNGCASPPPRPDVPDDGTLEIVGVFKKLYLTPKPGTAPAGFDLDDSCLLPGSETCTSPQKVDDDKGGLDNRAAQLFALFNDSVDLEKRANNGILQGKNGVLFRIAKYNGRSEDRIVQISTFSALGLLDGGANVPPRFEENEAWTVDEGAFALGLPSILIDGWVTGGKVYALFGPATTLRLSDTFQVRITGGVLQLDLDLTGAKPRVTGGVVAGRWPTRDMLQTVARQRVLDSGTSALCAPAQVALFELARQNICGNVDIMADRTLDQTGAPCDAMSLAFSFESGAASIGPRAPFDPEDDCPGFDAGACQR